ncbi:alpha/beta fold hydrolase [Natribacillus halophilus]|uniref:Pimeloyl-ACP methyl ester carboxylesterase n=1 Tax=Natribacillus halophilus TaxID=549003 RepID=A0A1G8KXW5_9BACI|nr:alpha/beta hydrolase [Natribacillus halophilus]SDI48213.1 Pimeloyl-ACP methyl ester carboxylesterase [Natribacillus halophilus]
MFLFKSFDGTQLHYDKKGDGWRTPLYFFHPPGVGAAIFREQRPLAKKRKVVALNARGHGASEIGYRPLTNEQWADDTYALAKHEGDDRIVVCGYSQGSLGALAFALRYPERTAGVVLIGGYPFVDTFVLKQALRLGVWTSALNWQPLISLALSRIHTKNKTTRSMIAASVRSVRAEVLKRWFELGEITDYHDRLHHIAAPLLLIYGEHDPYVRGYQEIFYSRVKRTPVQSVYIEGVGHQVPTKRSAELNAILERF